MSRDKQIEEMTQIITNLCETKKVIGSYKIAQRLYTVGYRKASDVAREAAYDFQNRLRHIFLDMCDYNDYSTLNLLQIDSAIEALYDTFIAELKKKYTKEITEEGK